ncbi:MAG: hypothetical protein PGN15_14045 [Aeromicrobium erythreum]
MTFAPDVFNAPLSLVDADDPERIVVQDEVTRLGPRTFDVSPGRYRLRVDSTAWWGGRSHATANVITLGRDERRSIRIRHPGRSGHEFAISDTAGEVLPPVRLNVRSGQDPAQIALSETVEGPGISTAGVPVDALVEVVDLTGTFRPRTVKLDDYLRTRVQLRPAVGAEAGYDPRAGEKAEIRGHVEIGESDRLDAYLYRADRWSGRLQGATVYPDRHGGQNLRFTHLRPGTYKVQLSDGHWYGGSSYGTAASIRVADGQVVTLADSQVGDWGTVAGTVRNERGTRLAGVLVTVYRRGQQDPVSREVTEGPNPFPAEGFVLDHLPSGDYEVKVSDVDGRIMPRWVGGGASRESAEIIRPVDGQLTTLPDVVVLTGLRATSTPWVVGRPRAGSTMRATRSTWSIPGVTTRRQWVRDGRPIAGATGSTYRLTRADRGHRIGFRATARAEGRPMATIMSRSVHVRR